MAESGNKDEPKPKRSKLPLILGLLGAVVLGAGGFFTTYTGLLGGGGGAAAEAKTHPPESASVVFLPIQPLVISLGPEARARHLRFTGEMELDKTSQAEVAHLMPRILDVLNGYLRAVEVTEFEDPTALVRLRAQMLRRIQIVAGDGRVRDLLITEFVVN